MKSKTILGADGATKMRQITVGIHGKGGEAGITAINNFATHCSNSVVWAGKEDEPPYVAVGFRAKKTGGKYRYVWLLKAKFKVPSEKYETKGESIKFNTPDIEADFTARKKDNRWKADFVGTEDSKAAKTWFTAIPEPAAAMKEV